MVTEEVFQNVSQTYVDLYQKVNAEYIRLVGNAIKRDALSKTQVTRINRLVNMGVDMEELEVLLAKQAKVAQAQVARMLDDIAKEEWLEAKQLAEYREAEYVPYNDNTYLQAQIASIKKTTADTFKNISNSTMLSTYINTGGNIQYLNIKDAYTTAVDYAIQEISSGYSTPQKSINKVLKSMANSGIQTAIYQSSSGKVTTQSIEVAVRRNVIDGMHQVAQGVQDYAGSTYGADAKQCSLVGTCAPDHLHLQGNIFPLEEWEKLYGKGYLSGTIKDINGKSYSLPYRGIGIWNCRHYGFSHIIGISVSVYSDEEIAKVNDNNKTGFKDTNGVLGNENETYTLYEGTQAMREIESGVRSLKYQEIALTAVGDDKAASSVLSKISYYEDKYKSLVEELEPYGIQADWDRFKISK